MSLQIQKLLNSSSDPLSESEDEMQIKKKEKKKDILEKFSNFKPKNAPNHFMQGIKTQRIKPISALRSKTPVYEKRKKPLIAISRVNEDDPFNNDLAYSALGKAKKDQS